jgi:hypothetical protein
MQIIRRGALYLYRSELYYRHTKLQYREYSICRKVTLLYRNIILFATVHYYESVKSNTVLFNSRSFFNFACSYFSSLESELEGGKTVKELFRIVESVE